MSESEWKEMVVCAAVVFSAAFFLPMGLVYLCARSYYRTADSLVSKHNEIRRENE